MDSPLFLCMKREFSVHQLLPFHDHIDQPPTISPSTAAGSTMPLMEIRLYTVDQQSHLFQRSCPFRDVGYQSEQSKPKTDCHLMYIFLPLKSFFFFLEDIYPNIISLKFLLRTSFFFFSYMIINLSFLKKSRFTLHIVMSHSNKILYILTSLFNPEAVCVCVCVCVCAVSYTHLTLPTTAEV